MTRTSIQYLAGAAFAAVALAPLGAAAQQGLLTRATNLEPALKLSSGAPLAEVPYQLESGKHYRLTVEADGTAELAIGGADFFRNVWINEIVVNDIEIRPLGVDSIEFDAAGEAEITFVTIRPGTFTLRIPGTTSETQSATFNVVDAMFAPGATGAAPAAGAGAEEEDDDDAN
jgi:hypothetical protein